MQNLHSVIRRAPVNHFEVPRHVLCLDAIVMLENNYLRYPIFVKNDFEKCVEKWVGFFWLETISF